MTEDFINDPEISESNKKVLRKLKKLSEKEKIPKQDIIFTSLRITDEYIAEQIYNPEEKKSKYCLYDFRVESITYYDEIKDITNGIIYRPIEDEEVVEQHIKLPSEPLEYESEEKLDEELSSFISKWLDIPDKIKRLSILNIKKSWLYDKFHTVNYLRALGEPGTGKSRFLDALGYLHYKPIATSGALTSAVLFRIINKWKGTILIDEADINDDDEKNDVIKIINQGYEKGRPVMRCDKEDGNKIKFFDVYCPKVISTRKPFGDPATESRCITYVTLTTSRKDIPPNINNKFWLELKPLLNKLLMFRFRNYNIINPEEEIDFGFELEPRLRQITYSYGSMFKNKPKELEEFKQFLIEYQKEIVEERMETVEGVTVKAIHDLKNESDESITASKIIEKANLTDTKGNLWKPRRLTNVMKTLGLGKTVVKWVVNKTEKVYEFDELLLKSLFDKYITNLPTLPSLPIQREQPKLDEFVSKDTHLYNFTCISNVGKVGKTVMENKGGLIRNNELDILVCPIHTSVINKECQLCLEMFFRLHTDNNLSLIRKNFNDAFIEQLLASGLIWQPRHDTYFMKGVNDL